MMSGVASAEGVVEGRPVYKTFQSRILGPAAIEVVSRAADIPFRTAFKVVMIGLLFVANAVALLLFSRMTGSWHTGGLYTALYGFLFAGLQAQTYIPIWDVIDLSLMLIFAWAVVTKAGLAVLLPLFVVTLLNREVALFISLWIALDSVRIRGHGGHRFHIAWGQALTGAALLAAGVLWTQWARDWRFQRTTVAVPEGVEVLGNQFWMLPLTGKILLAGKLDSIAAMAIAACAAIVIYQEWTSGQEHRRKVALLITSMLASIVMFGFITETRIWLSLIPFLLLPNISRADRGHGSTPAGAASPSSPEIPD